MSQIGEERPPRFTVRVDKGTPGRGQCMWELVVNPTTHRVLYCVKGRGHDGDHEYRIEAQA